MKLLTIMRQSRLRGLEEQNPRREEPLVENKKDYDMSEEILDDDFWLDEEDDEDILYGTAEDIEEKIRRDSEQPGYVKDDPEVFSEERPYEAIP